MATAIHSFGFLRGRFFLFLRIQILGVWIGWFQCFNDGFPGRCFCDFSIKKNLLVFSEEVLFVFILNHHLLVMTSTLIGIPSFYQFRHLLKNLPVSSEEWILKDLEVIFNIKRIPDTLFLCPNPDLPFCAFTLLGKGFLQIKLIIRHITHFDMVILGFHSWYPLWFLSFHTVR